MSRLRITTSIALLGAILTVGSCSSGGGGGGGGTSAPSSPEATVDAFMNAVRANSLVAMGDLWGTDRGPVRNYMAPDEVERRLSVMRIYLENEEYEILAPGAQMGMDEKQRVVRVQLTRRGCRPVVPFTVTRFGNGWLVSNVDLAAAGNPARPCDGG